jgi:hypothetical protein
MTAESILLFLFDLLDFAKCPQAEKFNQLYNNIDVYYVFKMRLPLLLKLNSPHKTIAMKLLHQYIKEKPIVEEESISLFFSKDASKNNVTPELKEAFSQFMRFHKRQLNNTDFGFGNLSSNFKNKRNAIGGELAASNHELDNPRQQLRTSFMYSNMRKISMSQNDPDEMNPVISMDSGPFNLSESIQNPKKASSPSSDFRINLDSISNNFKSVEKIKETGMKSPLSRDKVEADTPLFNRKSVVLKTEQ